MLLEVKGLIAGYKKSMVLHEVSLKIDHGEVVALIGHNGAGKTTTLKSIIGLIKPHKGSINWDGIEINGRPPASIVLQGISLVPQEKALFSDLSVEENLDMASYATKDKSEIEKRRNTCLELFPILRERIWQSGGTLSGGEQKMLAISMGLMLQPKLLMLDEPSLGLAPLLVQNVMENVIEINKRFGTAIILVEQNVKQALLTSQRTYVMKLGQIILDDKSENLLKQDQLWHLF
ncbi:MAG: ABC transporter ATP-binding protein [Candidatus Tectomicrobia bacterium]|uniref:ABC transporter ATP-binding protein n=1 Tax=Tectimicrobiota bacterium TaxID=2528274 RepID=A0A933LQN5_UNCTE|nr:ABC transporter ATP-binding protein [Candidatus Tectomicrobia bacterium]